VQRLAEVHKLACPHPVLEHVATRVSANVRLLEGAITRLTAYASLTGNPMTVKLADEVLTQLYTPLLGDPHHSVTHPASVSRIQKETCALLGLDETQLRSSQRSRHLVYARQVAMYLARELTNFSLPVIANQFGGRDHTTVLHAHRKIKHLLLTDPTTKTLVASLTTLLSQPIQTRNKGSSQFS
jgi:chromosomal replication initiator protein